MKKVIITGATGFIGGALTKKLLKNGVKVFGVDVDSERLSQMKCYGDFIPIVADFSQYVYLHDLINERDFDVFFHFAWAGSLTGFDLNDYEIQSDNIKSACSAVSEGIKTRIKKFVFISSSYQSLYKKGTNAISTIYGTAKKAAQDMCYSICCKNNVDYTAAILTNTYGVGDHSHKAVNTLVKKMLDNNPIELIEGNNLNDWMYIDETVNGLEYMLDDSSKNSAVYIGHKDITSFKEKILTMKRVLNSRSELRFGRYNDDSEYDYSLFKKIAVNNDILKSISFEESIIKTAEWVKTLNWEN